MDEKADLFLSEIQKHGLESLSGSTVSNKA